MVKQSKWNGRKVLVTGGAGFLGSNLCHELSLRGAHVVVVDNFLYGGGANPANLDGVQVETVRGDVSNIDLQPLIARAEVIFNLAARTSHIGGQQDPLSDFATNALAQIRLAHAVRETAPDAVVVHTSTRQVYGRPQHLPVAEDHPLAPPDANSISKLAGEQYWMLENRIHDRKVVSLRLTNCYGPRLRIRDGLQNFLGLWIGRVLRGEPFELWGGQQLRDLAFVDDVIAALIAAAETPACYGRIFNVGGSGPISLREVADLVVEMSGKDARYTVLEFPADRAAIDIGSYYTDDSAFRHTTAWAPTVNIRDGIGRTFDWSKRFRSAYL